MIDIHTHIGKIRYGESYLTAGKLVRWIDRKGIEKAVVLAIENPEELDYYVPSICILKSCRRYPDRLIPFCNVDPRIGTSSPDTDFRSIIEGYVEQGARIRPPILRAQQRLAPLRHRLPEAGTENTGR